MNKRCMGCGVILQSDDKEKRGYINDLKNDYCMRCFRLNHYNDLKKESVSKDSKSVISILNLSKSYVYFLCDILTINEEVIKSFRSITIPKILVLTKTDLLPSEIKMGRVIENIKKIYSLKEVLYLSSKESLGTNKIINHMMNHDLYSAYLVGYTNAGKSTLLNTMLKEKRLTTSKMPNTTLDFINIHINDLVLTDTPGLAYKNSLLDSKERIDTYLIEEKVKPITYPTKEETAFLIHNEFLLKNFGMNQITFYLSKKCQITRKYNVKNENLVSLEIPENSEIVINEVGFIYVKNACKIEVSSEFRNYLSIRPSILRGCYE